VNGAAAKLGIPPSNAGIKNQAVRNKQNRTLICNENRKARQMARIWQSAFSIGFAFWARPELPKRDMKKLLR
jgi:hypothetical protein